MFFWLSNPRFSSRFQVIKIGLWSLPPPLNTLSCTLQLPLFAFLFPAFCRTRNILQAIRAVSNSHVKIRIITLILVVYRSSKHDKAWSKWTFDDEAVVKQALHSNPNVQVITVDFIIWWSDFQLRFVSARASSKMVTTFFFLNSTGLFVLRFGSRHFNRYVICATTATTEYRCCI